MITIASHTRQQGVRVGGVLLVMLFGTLVAVPSVAQDNPSQVPLNLSNVSAALGAATTAASTAISGTDAQAATQSPESAAMSFFSKTELTGFADTYYSYNFNKPGTACATVGGVAVFNCLRNFDVAHNSFSLNLAEIALEKKPLADSRGGFRIDLDYGPTAAMVHAAEPGGLSIYQNIEQAYLSYLAPVGSGLQLDFGQFVTHNGAEVIETKDNWNYSRSLLFSWAIPYYHTGIRANYAINDKLALMGDVMNGWNNAVDNNTGKTVGAELLYKSGPASVILNYTGGPEQNGDNADWRHLFDTTVLYTLTPQVALQANYDYGKDTVAGTAVSWQGIAGYLKLQPNSWFAFIPRAEYYDDKNGFTTGTLQKVKEVTLTGEFKHKDGVIMRLEYRRDFSDAAVFPKSAATLVKSQDTLTFGFIYAFSSKTP